MEKKKYKLLDSRDTYKPFVYDWAYEAYLLSEQSHWMGREVPMLDDVNDWKNKLTQEQRNFLAKNLRFFVQSDLMVMGGYSDIYMNMFKHPEIRMMLNSFCCRESGHVDAYSFLIETLGMPDSFYSEFLEYKEMTAKYDYFNELVTKDIPFPAKIAAISAFTEGVSLFSAFVMLMNFPRHGKMLGLGQIISWSSVDETLHSNSMIKLFRTYIEENRKIWNDETKSIIYEIATNIVKQEEDFIDLMFDENAVENLTAAELKEYIKYLADRRLIAMGMKGIFKVKKNPLPWVEEIMNAPIHGNFFETKVTDYSKATLSGSWGDVWGKSDKLLG